MIDLEVIFEIGAMVLCYILGWLSYGIWRKLNE